MARQRDHFVVNRRARFDDLRAGGTPPVARATRALADRFPVAASRMTGRPRNSVASAAAGPRRSDPAIGWLGTKHGGMTPLAAQRVEHAALHAADVEHGAAHSSGAPRRCAAPAVQSPASAPQRAPRRPPRSRQSRSCDDRVDDVRAAAQLLRQPRPRHVRRYDRNAAPRAWPAQTTRRSSPVPMTSRRDMAAIRRLAPAHPGSERSLRAVRP